MIEELTKIQENILSEYKEEIILSIAIFGHGSEEHPEIFLDPVISDFYSKNVRVFSTACIPGFVSISGTSENHRILDKIKNKFSNSERSTEVAIREFKTEYKPQYQEMIRRNKNNPTYHQRFKDFARLSDEFYLSQSCDNISYFSNKIFFFYEDEIGDIFENPLIERIYNCIGIDIVDIKKKITNEDGIITYEPIYTANSERNPPQSKYLNIIYIEGFKLLLSKLKISKKDSEQIIKKYFEIPLDIKIPKNILPLQNIDLIKLFQLFKILNISYVNIFDTTCRTCKTNISDEEIYHITMAQDAEESKKYAFGGKSKFKKSFKRKNRRNSRKFRNRTIKK